MILRRACIDELPALSDLCFRSKAVWGYSDDFMAACREELTLQAGDLDRAAVCVAEDAGGVLGMVQVGVEGQKAELWKLFVEPGRLGHGAGRRLFDWAVGTARGAGAERLVVDADPDAEGFYLAMGMTRIGTSPSGSIPGRVLPHLALDLTAANARG